MKTAKNKIIEKAKDWERTNLSEDIINEDDLLAVFVKGKEIVLIKKQGNIYAMLNKCPHLECTLHYGTLEGFILKCPCHDWRFDIRNGEFVDAKEIKIETFDVKIINKKIYVKI